MWWECSQCLSSIQYRIIIFLINLLFLTVLGLCGHTERPSVWALHCGMQAFSRVAVRMGSLVVVCRLSCPEASRPGIEPASPAFKGGFLTTGPTGKSHNTVLLTVVTMLYIRSLECVLLKTENMYPLTCITLFSPSCKSLATTIAFSSSDYFRYFT